MILLRSLVLAFSTFSAIPMPTLSWKPESMRYMMAFFPLIGIAIGLVLWLWLWLCDIVGFGAVLRGIGVTVVPLLITGGIHLDGFADVIDAQASHAESEKKREILKDPHSGAFAVIGVASYLLVYAGFAGELPQAWHIVLLLGCMHVASRCLSGAATILFATSSSQGMLSAFHESAHKRQTLAVLIVLFVACAALMLWTSWPAAIAMLAGALVCLALLYVFAKSQFGGMSGDLAGFFLQVAELVMLICLVVIAKVVGA